NIGVEPRRARVPHELRTAVQAGRPVLAVAGLELREKRQGNPAALGHLLQHESVRTASAAELGECFAGRVGQPIIRWHPEDLCDSLAKLTLTNCRPIIAAALRVSKSYDGAGTALPGTQKHLPLDAV